MSFRVPSHAIINSKLSYHLSYKPSTEFYLGNPKCIKVVTKTYK